MNAPQIILLVLIAMDVGIKIANHGKRRTAYNAWFALADLALFLALLNWGGFFDVKA